MTERITTGCKVNLGLTITKVREDGYHELDSLFVPLTAPFDVLEFTALPEGSTPVFSMECNEPDIDLQNNTLSKAHAAFAAASGHAPPLRVRLTKGIPHGAGLGGGSSDAAAILQWCNAHTAKPLSSEALAKAALKVGADVPFFLHNVPARVRGIGEIVEPCTPFLPGRALLLACPPVHVSTPWAYAAWDKAQKEKFFLECLTMERGKAKDFVSCGSYLTNDFEGVVFASHPALRKLKESLLGLGADAVVMSGSGAALAALFESLPQAERASQELASSGSKFFASVL